jgi:hypothetical protein
VKKTVNTKGLLTVLLSLLFSSSVSYGQIYKCVDEAGNATYTTTPEPGCTLLSGSVEQSPSSKKPSPRKSGERTSVRRKLNPISAVARSKAQADLKAKLAERYSGSYATQKMLLDAGMEAYEKLCSLRSNKLNNEILSKLKSRYYPSFSTIFMLYEAEIEAYGELQRK